MSHVSVKLHADAQPLSDLQARVEGERAGRQFLLYRDGDDCQQLFFFAPEATSASVISLALTARMRCSASSFWSTLSAMRSTSRGPEAVSRNARSAMTRPIEKALLVIR